MPGGIEPHVADLEHLTGLCHPGVLTSPTAQRRAHARHQLAQAERFGHVVVGADLESDDRVDLGVASGDHDDGHLRTRPKLPAHVDARDARQHDVEQDERGARRVEAGDRLGTVGRDLDAEAFALERERSASRYDCSSSTTRMSGASASGADLLVDATGQRRIGVERKQEAEGRALSLDRLHRDLTAVGAGDVAHDGETESGAAGVAAARLVDSIEAFEDPFEVAARDADAARRAPRSRPRRRSSDVLTMTGLPGSEYFTALSMRLAIALDHLTLVALAPATPGRPGAPAG